MDLKSSASIMETLRDVIGLLKKTSKDRDPDDIMDMMNTALNSVNPAYSGNAWEGETLPEVEGCVWLKIHRCHITITDLAPFVVFRYRMAALQETVTNQWPDNLQFPHIIDEIQRQGWDLAYMTQEASPALGTKLYDPNSYSQSFNHWVLITKDSAMRLKLASQNPHEIVIYDER